QNRVAEVFLCDAMSLYRAWGADGKTAQMERRYPSVEWFAAAPRHLFQTIAPHTRSTTGGTSIALLDLGSILKATHALSSEVGLGGVLTRLLGIVRENSGAQTARLLLQSGDAFRLEGDATEGKVEVLQARPVSLDAQASDLFPLSLVRYVARTGEAIVEDQIR